MAMKLTGRAVREKLKGKVDPDVLFVLEHLAEYQSVLYQQGIETAQLVAQISDIVESFVGVATRMKEAVDNMQGKFAANDNDELV